MAGCRYSRALVICLSAVIGSVAAARAGTIYVDSAVAVPGNGTSWAQAFARLDLAIAAAAPGDELWVARGTYRPVDAQSSFILRSGVAIYGGFSGIEAARAQRNPLANPTILSGDIGADDVIDTSPSAPPWPENVTLNSANAGHVVVAFGVDSTAILDGVQVISGAYGPDGTAAGNPLLFGSGIYCINASPTIQNCTIRDNLASGPGGGIYLVDSQATIAHCVFTRNLADRGSGGAIFIGGLSAPTIRDCTFTGNLALSLNSQSGQGGAIHLQTPLTVTIARCTFVGNITRPSVGAFTELPRGGAISSQCPDDPATTIRECVFRDNHAALGGAVFVSNPALILNCELSGNTASVHELAGTPAGGEGAGVVAFATDATITNCTIVGNTGVGSGGIAVLGDSPTLPALALIHNTIVWNNLAVDQGASPRLSAVRGDFVAQFSCIQDLFTAGPGEDPINPADYPGCIAANPGFADPNTGNYRLVAGSPCVDRGRNALLPAGTSMDLDLNTRAVFHIGPGSTPVDMGAFEFFSAPSCAARVSIAPTFKEMCAGSPATFAVTVEGAGPFTYRWRRDGLNLTGATNATLQASVPGVYDCQVTSACGTSASAGASLFVGTGVQIDQQPTDAAVCLDEPFVFEVRASGMLQIAYQWRHNNVDIPGATQPVLSGIATSRDLGGTYDCVMTSACGITTSASATLTVAGPACCPADFNADGDLNPDDLADYINCYFALPQCELVDFNHDGDANPDDLGDYINAYFAGCR